jgi:PKD repeat protein
VKKNECSFILAILAVIVLVIVTLAVLFPQDAKAQPHPDWWQTDWRYRMPIEIKEESGSTLTNYQVPVTVNTTSFDYSKAQANGDDLRFILNGAECHYWIETYNTSGVSRIWVEVPTISANGTASVYMYYGNPTAGSSSNGTNTFEFFDDFEDGDISDWSQYSSGAVQIAVDSDNNTVLLKTANNDPHGGYSPSFYNGALSDFEAVFRTKRINEVGGSQNRYGIEDGSFNGYGPRMQDFNSLPTSFAIERRNSGSGADLVSKSTSVYEWDTWMTVKFRKYGSNLEFELYDSSGVLAESISNSSSLYNSFDRFVVHGGREFYTDDIRVRKYTSPEPMVILGEESEQAVADFSATPTSGISLLSVNFTDTSTGNVSTWFWDFGDSNNSTQQNPLHIYNTPGLYTVSLNISGPGGMDSETKTDYITVSAKHVSPTFVAYKRPELVTTGVQNITNTTATLSGDLTDLGAADEVKVYFKYGTSRSAATYLWADGNVTPVQTITTTGGFIADISNLSPGTTYYFRAVAEGDGNALGTVLTFTTASELEINVMGQKTSVASTKEGQLLAPLAVASEGNLVELRLPEGTSALDEGGNPLRYIDVSVVLDVPDPPLGYNIIGFVYKCVPAGATFHPAVNLTMYYNPKSLPDDAAEENEVIAYRDDTEWVILGSVVDAENNKVTAEIDHFTEFALMYKVPVAPPSPANFSVSQLSIVPGEVELGRQLTVTAVVTNTGASKGTCKIVCKVNGIQETAKEICLGRGCSQEVTFTVAKLDAASYTVDFDGLAGLFIISLESPSTRPEVLLIPTPAPSEPDIPTPATASVPPQPNSEVNWTMLGTIIGGFFVAVIIIVCIFRRRRD